MKKLSLILVLFFIASFSYGVFIATFEVDIVDSKKSQFHRLFWDYRGITHVVTKYTRGSQYPKDILLDAADAKVDFLFLTDLNTLNRPYNIQGYHGNIFTFTNQKISYLDSHILVYSPDVDFKFSSLISAQTNLSDHFSRSDFSEKGRYLAVLAHPFKTNHIWSGRYPKGIDGIEVLNLRKMWQEVWQEDKLNFLHSILLYPFNPKLAMVRLLKNPQKELALWDHLNQKSPTLGFLGSETTARIFNLIGLNFPFPKYHESFRMGSNHLLLQSELTGNEERDREKIFAAMKNGHFYFALDWFGDPKGFAAYIKDGEQIYSMGDQIPLKKKRTLNVDLPESLNIPFEIELYRSGKRTQISQANRAKFTIEKPGNYRIVVRIQPQLPVPEDTKWFSWIYTNHFYITAATKK